MKAECRVKCAAQTVKQHEHTQKGPPHKTEKLLTTEDRRKNTKPRSTSAGSAESARRADARRTQRFRRSNTNNKPTTKRDRDEMQNPTDYATPLEIHNHLSTIQQGNWLAGQSLADLSCQISLAQQCMPSPRVGQIQRANAWVRLAHQFADLKLTFLSIPPEKLRFVSRTDYSSKDQDGTGRTQGGYIIGSDRPVHRSGMHGAVVAAGVEVVQAETPARPKL